MAANARANFIIELSALPNGMFRIMARAPRGVITVDAPNPFTDQEIETLLTTLARPSRSNFAQGVTLARDFGAKMFDFLFSRQIYAAYVTTLAEAGENVRFRLSVERAGVLASLPWELIRDPDRDHLALSAGTPIVRTLNQFILRPPVAMPTPIRVLVMIASPTELDGRPLGKLDVEGEWTRLQEAVAPLRNRIELVRLDRATPGELQAILRRDVFHVFHFIGHSDYDDLTHQGVLIVEDDADETKGKRISAMALGLELNDEQSIRLVVLNSCHSGRLSERDALSSIVGNLATRGIGAVVAMQFAITDGSAKLFSEEFYRTLVDFYPIDAAVSGARRAIYTRRNNAEWATPVLYMRADDEGVLFTRASSVPVPIGTSTPPTLPDLPIDPTTTAQRKPIPSPDPRLPLIGAAIVIIALIIGFVVLPALNPPDPIPTLTPTSPIIIDPTDVIPPTNTPDPATLPDLRIGTIRVSPNRPAPGEQFRVNIPITNAGAVDSGAFAWAWDASVRPPLSLNTQEGTVENIPPGVTRTISVSYVYGWWGTYSAQIKIDVDSQVAENDERNNNLPFEIILSSNPFEIDFTLFPNNEVVQPPLSLSDDAFAGWGLELDANADNRVDCADVPLRLDDVDDGLIALSIDANGFPADCATLPIRLVVGRRVVANVMAEVLTANDGTVTMTLYGDAAGTNVIETFSAQTIGGMVTPLGLDDDQIRNVRRIDVRADGQPVGVTRLILFSPSSEMN